MSDSNEKIRKVKDILFGPAFDSIKELLMSGGISAPKLTLSEESAEVSFIGKGGRACKFKCNVGPDGKVYWTSDRPRDHRKGSFDKDAADLTPRDILVAFVVLFMGAIKTE
jgi:hypothetical protein